MIHKQSKPLPLDLFLLECFIHRNTGLEFAGCDGRSVGGFQCSNPEKYNKWLIKAKERQLQYLKSKE
jgi:hypothetical protein